MADPKSIQRTIRKVIAFGAVFEVGKRVKSFGSNEVLEITNIDGAVENPPGGFIYRIWFGEDRLLVVPATLAIIEYEQHRVVPAAPAEVANINKNRTN